MDDPTAEVYLRTGEIARMFRVNPKTVSRWARQGQIPHIETPGGHRRYPLSEVRKYLEKKSSS